MPGGNPVTEMPGETPTLPVMTLDPVLVTVEPPRTAKLPAVPRLTCANADEEMERNAAIPRIARRPRSLRFMLNLLFVNGRFGFTVSLPGLLLSHRKFRTTSRKRCAQKAHHFRRGITSLFHGTSRSGRHEGCRTAGWPGER